MMNRRTFLEQSSRTGLAALALPILPTQDSMSDLTIQKIESFTDDYTTIVKVTASDGSVGFGQMAPYNNNITTQVLHQMVAHHFLGKDPYEASALADRAIEINYKYPWSFVSRAVAGVETALWDLRGQVEQKGVVELLGGHRDPIRVYGSSMRRDITPQEEAQRMARLQDEQGFTAFKIRVGKPVGHNEDQWPGRTEEIIPTVRKQLDNSTELLADANSCYTADKAIEVGKQLQEHNYYFFEEPCPFWELEWTAQVNDALSMRIAGGEQDNDPAQWQRMLRMNAVDISQPDICYLGGLSRAKRVAEMAQAEGKTCVPHSANHSMLLLFTMHLYNAIDNPAPFLEYSIEDILGQDWFLNMYEPTIKVEDGKIRIPDGPGWGVQVRQDWLEKADYQISET